MTAGAAERVPSRPAALAGLVALRVTDREGREAAVSAPCGATLMLALRDAGLPVLGACGGMAACATCHVHLTPAWRGLVPPRSDTERDLVSFNEGYDEAASRLACQITLAPEHDGLSLSLAPDY